MLYNCTVILRRNTLFQNSAFQTIVLYCDGYTHIIILKFKKLRRHIYNILLHAHHIGTPYEVIVHNCTIVLFKNLFLNISTEI